MEEFDKTISTLLNIFAGIKRDDTRESLFNAIQILQDEIKLKEFKENYTGDYRDRGAGQEKGDNKRGIRSSNSLLEISAKD